MINSNTKLADRLVTSSIKLTRWLRAEDPAPQLSGPQGSALAIIVYAGSIKPSALAELEEVKRPSMARTIGQLSDRKLVKRVDDPADARSVFLQATPAGTRLIKDGQRRRIEPLRLALKKIPANEREAMEKAVLILEKLVKDRD